MATVSVAKPPCSVPECGRPRWARGLCAKHYQADYRTKGPPCIKKKCPNPSFAKGLCVKHYQAEYRRRGERCRKRNCENREFSRGLCIKHYHRWYHGLLRANESTSLKALPRKLKEHIPGLR